MHPKIYSGPEDNDRMLRLAHNHPLGHVHVIDLPYRLSSWALENPENVGLWEDQQGRLVAWAVLQTPFWTVDYALHPAAPPDAFASILTWVDGQARALLLTQYGHPAWFLPLTGEQAARRRDLISAGYVAQDTGDDTWSQVTFALAEGIELPLCPPKDGFTVRPLASEAEVPAYVALHRAVFGTENMTESWRRAALRQSAYRPELDLVIANASGELVAFCVGWLAQVATGGESPTVIGHLEPIGVHEDARPHGLAWSILAEAVRRLRAHGAGRVLVQTDNYRDRAYAFYQAAGFQIEENITLFRKEFDGEGMAAA